MITKDEAEVSLISHMGSDLSVVNAARVSFLGKSEELEAKDIKLIHFLKANQHDSVFEHCVATFLVECDLATAMQILRHRTFSYNMVSRRYTSEDLWFYIPVVFRKQAKSNRQASDGQVENQFEVSELFLSHYASCCIAYNRALELGVCREQARFLLPCGLGTKFYMTGNLRNWMHFLNLRDKEDVQGEAQDVAKKIKGLLQPLFPVTMEAFKTFHEKHSSK